MSRKNKKTYTIQSYGCNLSCPCSCLYCRDVSEKYSQKSQEKTDDDADMSFHVTPGC